MKPCLLPCALLALALSPLIAQDRPSPETGAFKYISSPAYDSLALVDHGTLLCSIPLPHRATRDDGTQAPLHVSWASNKRAAVIIIPRHDKSFIALFTKDRSGKWTATHITDVEDQNFGKLGHPPSHYASFSTSVKEWQPPGDNPLQVVLETQAIDRTGQRFTVQEPLLIKNGTPLWR